MSHFLKATVAGIWGDTVDGNCCVNGCFPVDAFVSVFCFSVFFLLSEIWKVEF